ncbi:MAG: DUF3943 domain-containing protein [Muribaculaceae bacterium]|nr:DUF3943 domain-containing protein [Muribaculaceae bacterium]
MKRTLLYFLIALMAATAMGADRDSIPQPTDSLTISVPKAKRGLYDNIYAKPYQFAGNVDPNWGRLWANTGVLVGAYVGALFVLECLPADATAWNRAEIQDVPLFKRWRNHVIKEGPEWDHDKFIFNYVLHPYAGAAYFMTARSCGFGFWQSMLYATIISNIGWEFGIEAFMERPSYQDLFITPVIGSCVGELFYRVKRNIVSHDYTLGGSRVLGNIVVFLVDPLNEFLNLMRGSDTRRMHLGRDNGRKLESSLMPIGVGGAPGFTLSVKF